MRYQRGTISYSRRLRGAGAWALLAAIWVPACGGSSSSPDTSSAVSISIEQLPSQLADAYCDNVGRCCQAASIDFDLATCKSNFVAFFQGSLNQVGTLKVSYDAHAAPGCVAAYTRVVTSCTPLDNSPVIKAACRLFVGTVALGAPCSDDIECARPAGGLVSCAGSASRTCSPAVKLKLGEPCSDTCSIGVNCTGSATSANDGTPGFCYEDDGLYCSSAFACQPLVAIGERCDSSAACGGGASCGADGTCTPVQASGVSCRSNLDCAGGFCQLSGVPSADGSVTGICGVGIASAINCAGNLGAGAN